LYELKDETDLFKKIIPTLWKIQKLKGTHFQHSDKTLKNVSNIY